MWVGVGDWKGFGSTLVFHNLYILYICIYIYIHYACNASDVSQVVVRPHPPPHAAGPVDSCQQCGVVRPSDSSRHKSQNPMRGT